MKNKILTAALLAVIFLITGFQCIDNAMRDCPGFYYDYTTNWRAFEDQETLTFRDTSGNMLQFVMDSAQITTPHVEVQNVSEDKDVICLLYATFFYTSPELEGIFSISFHQQDLADQPVSQQEVALYVQLHNENLNDYLYDYASVVLEPELNFWAEGRLISTMEIGGVEYQDVIELPFHFNNHSLSGQLQTLWAKQGLGILRLEGENGELYDRVL